MQVACDHRAGCFMLVTVAMAAILCTVNLSWSLRDTYCSYQHSVHLSMVLHQPAISCLLASSPAASHNMAAWTVAVLHAAVRASREQSLLFPAIHNQEHKSPGTNIPVQRTLS
jgi:hypothetical protein